MKTKWTPIGLLSILILGTVLLIVNQKGPDENTGSDTIELLKDSLLAKTIISERPNPISIWMNLNVQKRLINEYSNKDSLNNKDIEMIMHIDQQLNHMLHERN